MRRSLAYRKVLAICLSIVLVWPSGVIVGREVGGRLARESRQKVIEWGYRAGHLLVRFRAGVSESERRRVIRAYGLTSVGRLRGESMVERVEVGVGRELAIAAQLGQERAVEWVEPDWEVVATSLGSSVKRVSEPGSLVRRVGKRVALGGARAAVAGVSVAVIDSGVDFSHPDLVGWQWRNAGELENGDDDDRDGFIDDLAGWDFVTGRGEVVDEQGHGTMLAGLVAKGPGLSGGQVLGESEFDLRLMNLRVLDKEGRGHVSAAIEAIDYAIGHGAQVALCAWGLGAESRFLREAMERADRAGVVVVVAAGNDGHVLVEGEPSAMVTAQSPGSAFTWYPASWSSKNILAVGATDQFGRLTEWSNRGPTVRVVAPGVDLWTTRVGGGYTTVSGTSAAAAVVARVAARLKAVDWTRTAARVIEAITSSARREGTETIGVVDEAGAIEALRREPGQDAAGSDRRRMTPRPASPPKAEALVLDPPRPARGPQNLPRLDEVRRVRATQIRMDAPVPSRQRYCWPGDAAGATRATYIAAKWAGDEAGNGDEIARDARVVATHGAVGGCWDELDGRNGEA